MYLSEQEIKWRADRFKKYKEQLTKIQSETINLSEA
jgi:hypothetical protein